MKITSWFGTNIGEVVCDEIDIHPECEFLEEPHHKNIVYGISDEEYGHYGAVKRTFKPMKYRDYIHELKKQVNRMPSNFINKPFKKYAYITGRVKKGVVRGLDQYLMLLDSDGVKERKKAIDWLDSKGIRHFSIQSTPNKFWIICDKIGYVSDHTYMMDEIPGLDTRYTDCSRRQNVLLYRGFPKPGFLPEFEDTNNLKGSPKFKKWIMAFKSYWESEDMQEIANNLFAEVI